MALKWLNKIKFCVAVYLLSFSIHAQESDYTSIYNDSIPNKMEFDVKEMIKVDGYEYYKIKEDDEYIFKFLVQKRFLTNLPERYLYTIPARIIIESKKDNRKIAFILNDYYAIIKRKNIIYINNAGPLTTTKVLNPLLLKQDYKIKEITSIYMDKEIIFQDVDKPCELKIREKPENLTIESFFNLFEDSNFKVKASNCKLLFMYSPFSDWETGHPLDK
ncbi:hypothetical protein EB1_34880 [Empedobacter brevis NBRC 14943 = ATCC 43319]|uniref:Uncharacterized protein n=1 Tax=Empedobacter brevis NBRC 14943 = ATCC 43319 TaxID=1218108 RepID=A0A511NML2_9FLAO|nr:hypothetical protein [Empedobacter brevis]GEM53698.1 hypothetical protein EB1_34880 [Empedobacter brevis NBRC 14943 = ATCC 43319]